jgi:glycosyltransferase involved in cell wall biosynthesis
MEEHVAEPNPRLGIVLARYPVLSETFILRELLALTNQGFAITVFAFRGNPDDLTHPLVQELNLSVSYVPQRNKRWHILSAFLFWLIRAPKRLVRALAWAGGPTALRASFGALCLARDAAAVRPAHFHAHFLSEPAAAARTMALLLGVRFSASAHAHDLFLSKPGELARRVHQAAWVRTISRYNRRFLRSLAPDVPTRRIEVVRAGVDLPFLPYRSPRQNPERFEIVSVGRLVEIKGMDVLLAAIRLLQPEGWRLSIAGGGPRLMYLVHLVSTLGLRDRVRILGPLVKHDVEALLQRADLFVLACKRDSEGNMDGIPSALTEAMASGIPTISTRVSGIPELLGGGAGLLVDPDDPDSLASAIRLMMSDSSLRTRTSITARHRVERGYDLKRTGRLLALRLSALSGSPHTVTNAGC